MKRTLTLLLAALFTLSPLTLSMTACKQEEKPAVTTGLDLLKDFQPDEAFRTAFQKWADTENYTVFYSHQFRLGNGVGDPHTHFILQFSETRDGANVQYSHPEGGRRLELTYLDGILYVEKEDEKTKLTIAEDGILPYLDESLHDYFNDTRYLLEYITNERTKVVAPLSDSIVKTATAVQEGETVVVTFRLNKEEATAMMGDMNMLKLDTELDTDSFDIGQGTYTVTFDRNGVITKTRIDVELTFLLGNRTFYGYDSVEYNLSYGDARLEAPKKAESYTDVTGQPEIPA